MCMHCAWSLLWNKMICQTIVAFTTQWMAKSNIPPWHISNMRYCSWISRLFVIFGYFMSSPRFFSVIQFSQDKTFSKQTTLVFVLALYWYCIGIVAGCFFRVPGERSSRSQHQKEQHRREYQRTVMIGKYFVFIQKRFTSTYISNEPWKITVSFVCVCCKERLCVTFYFSFCSSLVQTIFFWH